MTVLTLIGAPQSNYVWTCRIACAEKGVACELQAARPHTPEITAIHPLGKIPGLRHGDVMLCESKAICTYIDRAFPGPGLIPASAEGAAIVEQWISIINTAVDPVFMRQYAIGYFFPGTPDKSPNRAVIDAALPKMEPLFALLDQQVARSGYLAGPNFTLADAFLIPILHYVSGLPEGKAMLEKSPALKSWLTRMLERPSVVATQPPART